MRNILLSICLFCIAAAGQPQRADEYDLVVYGGTAGGVMTAVSAAREGLRVALLEPSKHLGGMVTGGLSRTDYGKKEVIGGIALEFYQRAGKKYGREIDQAEWMPEPRVAEAILNEMIREAKTVTVFLNHRLREKGGVRKNGTRIAAITMENGARFSGKVFADASYEGDLMAQAGVEFTWGRESTAQYGESLAGVRPKDRNHQFDFPVSAYDEKKRLLPEIQKEPRGEIGAGDRKVQAYNYRMILTSDPDNRIEFAKPPGYDPARFELAARWLTGFVKDKGRAPRMNEVLLPAQIAGKQKWDFNNRGAFSTDYIGKSWDYPNASYKRRAEIWLDHKRYTQELFYFLINDPRVPKETQAEISKFGLAKDEFTDNGNWPYQLYVREARRMVGEYVVIQKDIQTELTKADVIGMGSYNSDSHNVQRYVTPEGHAQNEGNMEVAVTPYQIPYRILLPKRAQATNLFVPVCFSASHVTYSTLRMEPQYMIIGQAAGIASKMAIEKNIAVQEIDTAQLSARLKSLGAVFEWKKPESK